MRGLTTLVIMGFMMAGVLLFAVPVFDTLVPFVENMAPGYSSQLHGIRAAVTKWSVPMFFFTLILWAVFWILRQERQTVG